QSNIFFGMIGQPHALCLAASTGGGPLLDADTSLLDFRMGVPAILRTGFWHVTDQFGTFDLQTEGPDRLLVATAASTVGPPSGPPPAGSANHYACRRVRPPVADLPHGVPVTVADARGSQQRTLARASRLCSATDVDVPGTGMEHPRAHLMCYRLRS